MPLSTKQMEYLALAWQCFDSEPKIDYEKFKTVAGLKSAASARELMRVTKNKLKEEYGALSGSMQGVNGGPSPAKKAASVNGTPSSAGGNKRGRPKKATAEMEDDVDDAEPKTPSKKKVKTTSVKKEVKDDAAESSEEELLFQVG